MIPRASCFAVILAVVLGGTGLSQGVTTQLGLLKEFASSEYPQFDPAIASNGDGYLLTWVESLVEETTHELLYGLRLGADGEPQDSAPFLIAQSASLRAPVVASDGENYLVVWEDFRNRLEEGESDVYGSRVLTDGTVLDPGGIAFIVAPTCHDRLFLAWGSGEYLVIWNDGSKIGGAFIRTNGTVHPGGGFLIHPWVSGGYSAAAMGDGFLVVARVKSQEFDPFLLEALQVGLSGEVTGLGPVADLPPGHALWQGETRYSVDGFPGRSLATDGEEYLVAFTLGITGHREVYGAELSGPGLMTRGATFPLIQAAGDQVLPAMASAGLSDYVVVAESAATVPRRIVGRKYAKPHVPEFEGIDVEGTRLTLRWSSRLGRLYGLESTPSLSPAGWTPVGQPLVATGSTSVVAHEVGEEVSSIYYRVLLMP